MKTFDEIMTTCDDFRQGNFRGGPNRVFIEIFFLGEGSIFSLSAMEVTFFTSDRDLMGASRKAK